MSIINILEKEVSELIAAGEVIERPASIVKELLENSIDAKSTFITVEIKSGGIKSIRITDNGIGISKEDMPISFLRHATSKIKNKVDLDNINTLGFRGEALASVAAVSNITMRSKQLTSNYGYQIVVRGSTVIEDIVEFGCPDGTTIIVEDLFFNVPARLKFLKKDSSEASVVASIVEKIALSNPKVSFKFIKDGKVKLHTPGNNNLMSTIVAIYGHDFSSMMIPVSYDSNNVSVYGFISNIKNTRNNRSLQNFFINQRYIKSKTCIVALEEGYKNYIMTGKYPSCFLMVKLPANTIDVNVHPSKIEVRFVNDKLVFDTVYFAVKSALLKNDEINKKNNDELEVNKNKLTALNMADDNSFTQMEIDKNQKYSDMEQKIFLEKTPVLTVKSAINYNIDKKSELENNNLEEDFHFIKPTSLNRKHDSRIEIIYEEYDEKPEKNNIKDKNYKFIGEFSKTYAIIEMDNELILMDKHAAHERILFEELKSSLKHDKSQVLMNPIVVPVSNEELDIVKTKMSEFNKLGFYIDDFGSNSIVVREVPLILSEYEIQDIVLNIIKNFQDNKFDVTPEAFEKLIHSMACRAAIKGNDKNSNYELIDLFEKAYNNQNIRNCPHGRPIFVVIKKSEIEKRFGRI